MKKRLLTLGILFLLAVFLPRTHLLAQAEEESMEGFLDDVEQRFNISGFMTFQYVKFDFKSEDNTFKNMMNEEERFALNNLNLYLSFNVSDDLLAFSEIRFLFTPTGKEQLTPVDSNGNVYLGDDGTTIDHILVTPYDNSAIDNQNSNFKYGSVFIERAYIEWNTLSYATLRFGRYITPFGIWSQDHGAPAVTSIRLPLLVNSPHLSLGMPQWQTGVELLGKLPITGIDMYIDYAAYVGNGVSDSESILDEEDKNKAVGGFINFKLPPIARMIDVELGCSGYWGERTFVFNKTLTPIGLVSITDGTVAGNFETDSSNNVYYNKQMDTIGTAHMKISMRSLPLGGTLVLQSEYLYQWIDEDGASLDSNRQWTGAGTHYVDMAGQPRNPDDYKVVTYYVQGEYQFFGRVTPYFRYEWFKIGTDKEPQMSIRFSEFNVYTMGLNIKPYQRLILNVGFTRLAVTTPGQWLKVNAVTQQPTSFFPFKIDNDIDTYMASITLSF